MKKIWFFILMQLIRLLILFYVIIWFVLRAASLSFGWCFDKWDSLSNVPKYQ